MWAGGGGGWAQTEAAEPQLVLKLSFDSKNFKVVSCPEISHWHYTHSLEWKSAPLTSKALKEFWKSAFCHLTGDLLHVTHHLKCLGWSRGTRVSPSWLQLGGTSIPRRPILPAHSSFFHNHTEPLLRHAHPLFWTNPHFNAAVTLPDSAAFYTAHYCSYWEV